MQNIAFRVTLPAGTTVLHLGDADTRDAHFEADAARWAARGTQMAFPPYWYFRSDGGLEVLTRRLDPGHAVGVHVPVSMPDDPDARPAGYEGFDLFTEPGETRVVPATRATTPPDRRP